MVYVPFDQAQAKYATAAQGGKAPDVMRADPGSPTAGQPAGSSQT